MRDTQGYGFEYKEIAEGTHEGHFGYRKRRKGKSYRGIRFERARPKHNPKIAKLRAIEIDRLDQKQSKLPR